MFKQLLLIKYGNFDYTSVETMPIYELNWYFNKLLELKKQEKDDSNEQ